MVEEEVLDRADDVVNDSCIACHPNITKIYNKGTHKTLSCEECHGGYSDHVKDDKVIGEMQVLRNSASQVLCMVCHDAKSRNRPEGTITTVNFPEHLQEKQVGLDRTCDQCHHVHAPMIWVYEAREMVGLPIDPGES